MALTLLQTVVYGDLDSIRPILSGGPDVLSLFPLGRWESIKAISN